MSGICGWLGQLSNDESPEQVLAHMANGLPSYGDCKRTGLATSSVGLCLNARTAEGHWYSADGLYIAIEGAPYWIDDALINTSTRRGHAAALADAYRAHGNACLAQIHGSFAFALVDASKQSALIAIDRVGTSPMCYATKAKGFLVFGSTVDSVAAHRAVDATLSPQSLFNFLYFIDRVPAPYAIYKEQAKLIPGQYLFATPRRQETGFYWRPPYREDDGKSLTDLGEEMFGHLRAAVRRATSSSAPGACGTFLSGGLDSSTMAGLLAEQSGDRARTFTIRFENDEFDESTYARIVSERFNTQYNEYSVTGEDALQIIPKIAKIYDEPFSNHSTIPTYYCAKMAREAGVDLLLAGDGGDELFAGNTRYLTKRRFDSYARIPELLKRRVIERLAAALPATEGGLTGRIRNNLRVANMSVPVRMYYANLFYRIPTASIFSPDLVAEIDPQSPIELLDEIYDSTQSGGPVKRMMHTDLRITLADGDLRKVYRMCELADVGVRFPFLDDDVVEFAARVPEGLLIKDNQIRYFYKRAVETFLPKEVINKKKHGFGLPIADLSDQHRPFLEFACDCVTDLKQRRYFQADFLDELIDQHRGIDRGQFRLDIFEFVFFELWHKFHVDGSS